MASTSFSFPAALPCWPVLALQLVGKSAKCGLSLAHLPVQASLSMPLQPFLGASGFTGHPPHPGPGGDFPAALPRGGTSGPGVGGGHPPHSLCNFQTSPPPSFNPLATLNIHQPAMPPMPLPVLAATTSQPLPHILGRVHCLPCAPASFSMTPASTHAPSAPHSSPPLHPATHSQSHPGPWPHG